MYFDCECCFDTYIMLKYMFFSCSIIISSDVHWLFVIDALFFFKKMSVLVFYEIWADLIVILIFLWL